MLGVGSGSSKSGKIRKLIKNGLQAWYKADKTQAPLGEEEIVNGDFSEKGPDLIADEGGLTSAFDSADFTHHSDGTMTINGNGNRNWVGGDIDGDSVYKVIVDIVSGTAGKFFIGGVSSSNFSGTGINIRYILTTASSSSSYVSFNDCDGMVVRSCSVEKMDPNDNWGDNAAPARTWTAEDGKLTHTQGTGDDNQCRQTNVIKPGKKYQVNYSIVDYTSGSVRVDLGDPVANQGTARSAVGDYSEIIENTGTNTFVDIEPVLGGSNTFIGAISNLSVREVINSVKDFSPNTNNGVLYSGKALHFDQQNTYIDIDYWKSETINANTKATYAVWFNSDDVDPTSGGAMMFAAAGTNRFYLGAIGAKLELGWGSTGWQSYETQTGTAPAIVNQTWYRAVVVVDGLTCRVYLNGELAFSKTNESSFTLDDNGVYIGVEGDADGNHWYGELADFQIYDKAWTASDVTYDYNNPDKDVFDDEGRAEVLGSNVVADGDFPSGTVEWNPNNTNIVLHNGYAEFTAGGGTAEMTHDNTGTPPSVGSTVLAQFTVSNISSGNAKFKISEPSSSNLLIVQPNANGYQDFTNGTYSYYYTVESSEAWNRPSIDVLSTSASFRISNFSIKKVDTHAGEISPTDCTALYRLNEGAGNRVYNAAPVLREDLTKDYDFDDTTWSRLPVPDPSSTTTITNSNTFSTGGDGGIYKTLAIVGSTYKLTIAGTTNASGFKVVDASGGKVYSHISSPGDFNVTVVFIAEAGSNAVGTTAQLYLRNLSAGTTTITTLKLQEITINNSYVQIAHEASDWKTAQPYIPQYAMSSYSKKMVFDGSNDCVDCDSSSSTDNIFDSGGSWSSWFSAETDGESNHGNMLSKGNTKRALRTTSDASGDITMQFLCSFSGDDGKWSAPDDAVLLNKINHIVVTYDSSSASNNPKIYINGVSVTVTTNTTPTGSADAGTGDFTIGAQTAAGGYAYDGFIDEVSIWDKELSATEVQEIFNSGIALDCRDHSAYLGSEELTNADFSTSGNITNTANASLGWKSGESDEVGASISGGELILDRPTGGDVDDARVFALTGTSDQVLTIGRRYQLTYTISSVVGSATLHHYTGAAWVSCPNSVGTHTVSWLQATSKQFLIKNEVESTTLKLSSVSVKEVQLSGYWRNNGADTWTDLSPYGNNGTVVGSPTTIQLQEVPYFKKDTFGLPMNKVRERALNLDGDSYVEIADDNSLNFGTGAFSIDGWARFAFENSGSSSGNAIFVSGGNPVGASSGSFAIFTNIGGDTRSIKFFVNGEAIEENITSRVADGDWFHFAATRSSNGDLELYIDSESVGTLSPTGNSGATVATTAVRSIGRDGNATTRNYKNLIDGIRLYDRELLSKEVAKNFKATKSKHKNNIVSNWSDDFSDSFI